MYYLWVVNFIARKFVVLGNLLSSSSSQTSHPPSMLRQEGLGQFEVHKIEEKNFSYYVTTPLPLSPFPTFNAEQGVCADI